MQKTVRAQIGPVKKKTPRCMYTYYGDENFKEIIKIHVEMVVKIHI